MNSLPFPPSLPQHLYLYPILMLDKKLFMMPDARVFLSKRKLNSELHMVIFLESFYIYE